VVAVGATDADPDELAVTYPTLLMNIVVALPDDHESVEEPPFAIDDGVRVTEQVGGGLEVQER
jgi:hypothetical protein